MEIWITITALFAGAILLVRWMVRSTVARTREESLSPADLRALEDAAARVVTEIQNTAQENIDALKHKCDELRDLLARADGMLAHAAPDARAAETAPDDTVTEAVYRLADDGLGTAEIAGRLGLEVAEVRLALAVRSCGGQGEAA